jgi:hypothetical protein
MRSLRAFALAGFAGAALACATPCQRAETRSERFDYERDHERCVAQSNHVPGSVDPGDYVACMQVRGWCEAPREETYPTP